MEVLSTIQDAVMFLFWWGVVALLAAFVWSVFMMSHGASEARRGPSRTDTTPK